MKSLSTLKNETGSTLIETLVAMAILVSVLLPVSMFLGYAGNSPRNEEEIVALGLAQAEMEKTLSEEKYTEDEKIVGERWIVKKSVISELNLMQIEVSVYRNNKAEPLITLTTERLFYEVDPEQ